MHILNVPIYVPAASRPLEKAVPIQTVHPVPKGVLANCGRDHFSGFADPKQTFLLFAVVFA